MPVMINRAAIGPHTRSFSAMSGVGGRFPRFALTGVVSNDVKSAFQAFTHDSFPGKWKVVFFWPKDFTFVCPTEIAAFGKLDREFRAREAQRATFIVDPHNVIRFVYVTDLNVGRNPEEVLRVLDALQTDELCPCNWQKGEETLKAA
jgi:lipoyl-dependent peroxiredoxin subunit C